jgi:pheganomycin biosynthesis PGM1-like protein/ATP-grasp domain-containing protein
VKRGVLDGRDDRYAGGMSALPDPPPGPRGEPRRSFDELARSLAERHPAHPFPDPSVGTLVVVPSLSFPVSELVKIVGIQFYEERLLFTLLLLADPGRRLVYVTSAPVEREIVDYYLSFLPDPRGAARRLHMVALDDVEPRSLTEKLLGRPDVLARVRALVGEASDALLLTFNVTRYEQALTERLGVPLFGPRSDLIRLGSKTGSRRTARAAGVRVLAGSEDLWSVHDVAQAVDDRRSAGAGAVVVKLNNGFSGQGNAIIRLDPGRPGRDGWRTEFCAEEESWPTFGAKIATEGAVVEELVTSDRVASPSAQVSVAPDGDIQVVSTHDQILGGPSNQVYLGCRFPARPEYRLRIQQAAAAVAGVLQRSGVIGAFGVDFFVDPQDEGGRIWVVEINLRMGGTTHPYWMTRMITGASYDPASGELRVGGEGKCYVATDNLKAERLVGTSPAEVIESVAAAGLAWEPARRTGVALHLLGALRGHGKMGVTCIGDSLDEATALDREVRALLLG